MKRKGLVLSTSYRPPPVHSGILLMIRYAWQESAKSEARSYAPLMGACCSAYPAAPWSVAFTVQHTVIRLIVNVTSGFITGGCSGGSTEMKLLLVIIVITMLLGPLRHWAGRHWAFLVSVVGGAIAGFVLGAILTRFGAPAVTPLVGAIAVAIECGQLGPELLRQIEKDGKK
jgi:hypothetical protein